MIRSWSSARDANYEIYVMNSSGGKQLNITQSAERDDYPAWHPDGRHLVFVGEREGRFDLYQIDVANKP